VAVATAGPATIRGFGSAADANEVMIKQNRFSPATRDWEFF
jgi:hypothetical protein